MLYRALVAGLLLTVAALVGGAEGAPAEDFAFVQITDMHLSPHLARSGAPGPLRGADSIAWICRRAVGPQTVPAWGITTPAPAFGLATGDLTEYGVIDDTWALFEQAFEPLPYPLYVLPGNHDNTWVAMYHVMRRQHGDENYSFDRFGCHFACICSASPQEPVPTIDGKTRAWLERDLASIPPGTPVFMALHHPPYSSEFANPAEYDTFVDLLRDYNVVLMLYGHGHAVSHRNMDGVDGVMGGSTYGKNAGYALISVQDDMLRVAYHYYRLPGEDGTPTDRPGWRVVLEKRVERGEIRRLFRIREPQPDELIEGTQLDVVLAVDGRRGETFDGDISIRIDGQDMSSVAVDDHDGPAYRVSMPALTPGRHFLAVRGRSADGKADLDTVVFRVGTSDHPEIWRRVFPAAIKAGPVLVDNNVLVAGTDGVVRALSRADGARVWTFESGGEILGTPTWSGHVLVFGSGDGKVYALDDSGKTVWSFDAGRPVYGWPLVDGDTVYIGDNGGRLHALDMKSGKPRWTFSRADYAIECRPCLWGELVVFGAWDGYLYAVHRADGSLAWKVPGPKSSDGHAMRYYAPADCGPLAIEDTLFVCDRGYLLGSYGCDGVPGEQLATAVAAIAPEPAGRHFVTRTTDDRVCRFDAAGRKLWEQAVQAGRFPVPPTCHGDAVYICSNRGLLSVLSVADGRLRRSYQVTPGLYVMAPLAVDERGTCYVAGMDGSVTAVRTAD